MIGVQDFIGYYDWTFEYLRREHGGDEAVQEYWAKTIAFNSQAHAVKLITEKGFEGMAEYWGHTLVSEDAGFSTELGEDFFRIDMYDCPSKGFLIQKGQQEYHSYCAHCMGWIKPIMDQAGFGVEHERNNRGQCWWLFREKGQGQDENEPGEEK